MGFVVKEERREGRGERKSSGRPRALAIVDVSRRYDEGARIGSSVLVRLLACSHPMAGSTGSKGF